MRTEDGALIRLVEEALRLWTVVHMRVRVARQDVELGGVTIRAGDRVHPVNASANRDPARYPRPDAARHRPAGLRVAPGVQRRAAALRRRRPGPHGGGRGARGASSARVPRVRLDPTREQPRYLGFVARSFRPLWLVLSG